MKYKEINGDARLYDDETKQRKLGTSFSILLGKVEESIAEIFNPIGKIRREYSRRLDLRKKRINEREELTHKQRKDFPKDQLN